jgi:FkbM family methyltransferase
MRLLKLVSSFVHIRARVGTLGALKLGLIRKYNQAAERFNLRPCWPVVRLRPSGYHVSVYLRTGTSDYDVLCQIFSEREYEPLDSLDAVESIIDCGANVGYSSVYFLNRYPDSRVIAVEPDPANAAMCRRNLETYGDRVRVLQSGLWSHPCRLALVRGVYGDGRAWATQVRELNPDDSDSVGDLTAIDMPTLLAQCRNGRADLLKVDIERSEVEVFRGASEWLPRVRNIAIELHDGECEAVFLDSLRGFEYEMKRSGELTICRSIGVAREFAPRADGD